LYALCALFDVIIIEDDPYWYLQFPSASRGPAYVRSKDQKSSGFPFLDSLIPSYLSVDFEGRVIRLDTFSKTIAPGCRLGWITAQPALVERILRITETSTQQPSGFVQSMVAQLILGARVEGEDEKKAAKHGTIWKADGWVRWLEGLRGNYERRMTAMCDILDEGKTLVKSGRRNSLDAITELDESTTEWAVVESTQIYNFVRPVGGMFVWVRFAFSTHPLRKVFPLSSLAQALWVFWTKKPYLVLVTPGTIFAPTEEIRERDAWECFRICFAACEEDEIEPLSKRFVKGAKDFWRIKSKETIDELLDELKSSESQPGKPSGDIGLAMLSGFC
jgi:DNA-binding transcriptional MocR family regulator